MFGSISLHMHFMFRVLTPKSPLVKITWHICCLPPPHPLNQNPFGQLLLCLPWYQLKIWCKGLAKSSNPRGHFCFASIVGEQPMVEFSESCSGFLLPTSPFCCRGPGWAKFSESCRGFLPPTAPVWYRMFSAISSVFIPFFKVLMASSKMFRCVFSCSNTFSVSWSGYCYPPWSSLLQAWWPQLLQNDWKYPMPLPLKSKRGSSI